MQETEEMRVQSLGEEDPLEQEMANSLQYSCLENPRDGGAWWAAVCGVAQGRTRLKRLSSSSSSSVFLLFFHNFDYHSKGQLPEIGT